MLRRVMVSSPTMLTARKYSYTFKSLEEGQKVTFDTECDPQNSSKIRATNVTVVA